MLRRKVVLELNQSSETKNKVLKLKTNEHKKYSQIYESIFYYIKKVFIFIPKTNV